MLLQQLCYYGYYENIDKGVTRKFSNEPLLLDSNLPYYRCMLSVFRHGDVGSNWYVCLSGSVDVVLPGSDNSKVRTKLARFLLGRQIRF